jgi:thiol-disulfide isomerase/thioredoxin
MKQVILFSLVCLFRFSLCAQKIEAIKLNQLVKIMDTADRPLVIHFWASYCAPCIKENPWLEEVVAEYDSFGVQLLLISLDPAKSYPQKLEQFVKLQQYDSKVYWFNEWNSNYYRPKIDSNWRGGIPATLFLYKKNKYRSFYGRQMTDLQLKQEIDWMLGRKQKKTR